MTWHDIARRQHGVIRTDQLRMAGVDRGDIARLLRRGELVRTGRRAVWSSSVTLDSPMRSAWLAVLATDGVLSHVSAAHLWQLELPRQATQSAATHVTIPLSRRVRPAPTVRIHRRDLAGADISRLRGLPVTSRLTTAIDCLATIRQPDAVSALDRWLQTGQVSFADVARRINAEPYRHGAPQVRRTLSICAAGDAASERMLHRLLRQAGINGWQANARIGRYVADILFAEQRLVIEVDGLAHHVSPDRFQRDRTRQNALVNAGWTVLRFTWADITRRPDEVLASVRRALAQQRHVVERSAG